MKKIAILISALLYAMPAFATTTTLNVTVPGSGTPFLFGTNGTQDWPLAQPYDGTNLGVVNPNGQASANNSAPVVLPSTQVSLDPCALQIKTIVPISFSTAAITQVVAPQGSPPVQTYICGIILDPTLADTISVFEGTGSTCNTGTPAALIGSIGTTLSLGMPVGAVSGFVYGNGEASPLVTKFSGDGVCIGHTTTSGNQVGGSMAIIRQ